MPRGEGQSEGGGVRGGRWRGAGAGGRGGNGRGGAEGRGSWRGGGGRGGGGRGNWRGGRWRGKRGGEGASGRGRGGGENTMMPPPGSPRSYQTPQPTPDSASQGSLHNPVQFSTPPQDHSDLVHTLEDDNDSSSASPFRAWKLYLPTERYAAGNPVLVKLQAALKFLHDNLHGIDRRSVYSSKCFNLDFEDLMESDSLTQGWPGLKDDLIAQGEVSQGVFGLALHHLMLTEEQKEMDLMEEKGNGKASFPIVRTRIVGYGTETPIRDLKTGLFGRLVTVHGTVVRVSAVRPTCTWLTFQCLGCPKIQSVYQPGEGKFLEPKSCNSCRSRKFAPLRAHTQTIAVDRQCLRLQEIVRRGVGDQSSGRVPRTIECELVEDLCDAAGPGDVVTLSGVVKYAPLGDKSAANLFQLQIHALSIINTKTKSSGGDHKGGEDSAANSTSGRDNIGMEFDSQDFQLVREIHSFGKAIFKLLVHSLCPSIFGHEMVKAGLLLGLFGGSTRRPNSADVAIRGDPHILVVGDPGLGKSQMLNACASVAPRGVFVTGNTTTSSGLTVTLTKEAGNEFALEAGALVLADQGCCCIDEFDKMTSQHLALLEAMEQQAVSLAKSGVVCSLPARTAVLAAANPIGGHYDKSKTVSENLKLNPALLSRFDLVFILIDRPNEQLDGLLSNHIMKLHMGGAARNYDSQLNETDQFYQTQMTDADGNVFDIPLFERLKQQQDEEITPVAPEFLRKYIAYARRYVSPRLGPGARKVLQDFYLELRQEHQTADSTPITLRQLESLIRLTEARAKMELREVASERDAKDVVEILRASMADTLTDELGTIDYSRSVNGAGMTKRGAAKKFIAALTRTAQVQRKKIFSVDDMKQVLASCRKTVDNFHDFLEKLNHAGFLLKKTNNLYQLQNVDM